MLYYFMIILSFLLLLTICDAFSKFTLNEGSLSNKKYKSLSIWSLQHDAQSLNDHSRKKILPILNLLSKSTILALSTSTLIAKAETVQTEQKKGYQTPDGLVYFDFIPSDPNLPTPKYGQLISFQYATYFLKDRNSPLEKVDSSFSSLGGNGEPFLQKHGNGRVIPGLEEGIHSMTVGSRRRLIIPQTLGYYKEQLGPYPVNPNDRRKLNKAIDSISRGVGQLVIDVELVLIIDDENDEGYYEDVTITQDEVRQQVIKYQQNNINLDIVKPPN